jgi:hypothetical protein
MLKEIHLAGSVRTPFGSFSGSSPMSRQSELGKGPPVAPGTKLSKL